jgi:hypothetical protein
MIAAMHQPIERRAFLRTAAGTALALGTAPALAAPRTVMTTFHDPGCGCCLKWADAMRKAGFTVTVREADMRAVKQRLKA